MNNLEENLNSFCSKLSELEYDYVRPIGKGSYSDVHLVFSKKYNQHFALKQNIKSSKKQIQNEFELLKQLDHPHIIHLYSMVEINSATCLVFEFCSGGTIESVVESYGRIRPPKLYNYCFQILSAVEYIHTNQIAHRDIKPSNFLFGSHNRLKLIDFGLSQQLTSNKKSLFSGSKLFMSPEIWLQIEGYDPFFADVYSLGVTFYFMAEGKYPFHAYSQKDLKNLILYGLRERPKNIEGQFFDIICQMMNLNPRERPTISQLIAHPLFNQVEKKQNNVSFKYPKLETGSINYD